MGEQTHSHICHSTTREIMTMKTSQCYLMSCSFAYHLQTITKSRMKNTYSSGKIPITSIRKEGYGRKMGTA